MRLYYPKHLYNATARWHIFPLLKTLLKEKKATYKQFTLKETEEEADAIVLPMSWNYYHRSKLTDKVMHFYLNSNFDKTRILSFVFGDFGVKVPYQFKGIVLRTSGRKSKLPSNHKGMPVFVEDPISNYYGDQNIIERPFSDKPIIGFCGQAMGFGVQTIKELFITLMKNMLTTLNLRYADRDQLISTTYFRWKILKNLKKSNQITCNFIERDKYRAGITTEKENHPTTVQFYDNIKNSDYVVCMRGAGNFSTRFYETLAMGRIPVFVNTDCLLPLEDSIPWKTHVVWVAFHERHKIAQKITEFHHKHTEVSLNALFRENRKLWEDYLQLYPFFNHLNSYLS
jgi:hypothetical protein